MAPAGASSSRRSASSSRSRPFLAYPGSEVQARDQQHPVRTASRRRRPCSSTRRSARVRRSPACDCGSGGRASAAVRPVQGDAMPVAGETSWRRSPLRGVCDGGQQQLGDLGRRIATAAGDSVQDRVVGFVADAGDDRKGHRHNGPCQRFIIQPEQVGRRTAAPDDRNRVERRLHAVAECGSGEWRRALLSPETPGFFPWWRKVQPSPSLGR